MEFNQYIDQIEGLEIVSGASSDLRQSAFTQVVLRLDEQALGWKKMALKDELYARGIQSWHANFEPINSLTFFREEKWKEWVVKGDIQRIGENYHQRFPVAEKVYQTQGMGLGKMNFLSSSNRRYLRKQIDALLTKKSA